MFGIRWLELYIAGMRSNAKSQLLRENQNYLPHTRILPTYPFFFLFTCDTSVYESAHTRLRADKTFFRMNTLSSSQSISTADIIISFSNLQFGLIKIDWRWLPITLFLKQHYGASNQSIKKIPFLSHACHGNGVFQKGSSIRRLGKEHAAGRGWLPFAFAFSTN